MVFPDIQTDWWKWGNAAQRKSLTDYPPFQKYLEALWNLPLDTRLFRAEPLQLADTKETENTLFDIFERHAPEIKKSSDRVVRLKRAAGRSFPELFAAAASKTPDLPGLVVFPKTHDEVLQILSIASAHLVKVYPFGGGTNVVAAFKMPSVNSRIAIDLSEMNRMLNLDAENLTATFSCGIFGPAIEKHLNEKGFSLGHFPQSFEFSTLGGWIATRSAGQESSYYGRIEDLVISLKIATPKGTVETSKYEADAEGINLKSLFFGSEGTLGVATEAVVKIHPVPRCKSWSSYLFPDFTSALQAIKDMIQSGLHPTIIRLSDEEETFLLSRLSTSKKSFMGRIAGRLKKKLLHLKKLDKPCLLIFRLDGDKNKVRMNKTKVDRKLREAGGYGIGKSSGEKWEASRYNLPYLQDDLIERGILIDTIETVLPWNKLTPVKQKIHHALLKCDAFNREKGILIAHVSHVYVSAASIYFTILTPQHVTDTLSQWNTIRSVVIDIIIAEGGALSHHHSIGTDLKKWYCEKTDPLTIEVLRQIKKTVDPNHILNPGKLFDE